MLNAFSHRKARRGDGRGFTIIELLVATVIMVILTAIVGRLMNACKTMSSKGMAKIRANTVATSISDALRRDFGSITRSGFLRIADSNGHRAVFTVGAPTRSLVVDAGGSGAVVDIGMADNQAAVDSANNRILFRNGWVLRPQTSATSPGNDVLSYTLGDVQMLSVADIRTWVDTLMTPANSHTDQLAVPPRNLTELQDSWRVIAPHCRDLSIQWTDGDTRTDGTLIWNDPNSNALWTHHDQTNWPKAVKLRFKLRDPAMPEDFTNVDYEVICPVGQ